MMDIAVFRLVLSAVLWLSLLHAVGGSAEKSLPGRKTDGRDCRGCPCAVTRSRASHSLPGDERAPMKEVVRDEWADVLEALSAAMARHKATSQGLGNKRPFITVTYAQGIDGSIADEDSRSLPLSSPEAFNMTHHLRAVHGAILVGVQTVINDDPSLTVRLCDGRHPTPVVLDSRLRTPLLSRLASSPDCVRPIVATTSKSTGTDSRKARARALEAVGCRIECLEEDEGGNVDLAALFAKLAELGIESVMVEGGSRVITSMLSSGLVDFAIVTIAPRYVGGLRCYAPPARAPQQKSRSWMNLWGCLGGQQTDEVGRNSSRRGLRRNMPCVIDATPVSVGGDVVVFGMMGTLQHRSSSH